MYVWIVVAGVAATLTSCTADHFGGGTISWKPIQGYTVEFHFKMSWTYGTGPGCNEHRIGQYVNGQIKGPQYTWRCTQGCLSSPVLHSASYICSGASRRDDYEQGQMSFSYTFPNSGPFVVTFGGKNWRKLGHGKGIGPWRIATTIDLRTRNDTGRPNRSPITSGQSIYYMQYGCHHQLKIPVLDPDGDKVLCQWAQGNECMAVCNGLPGAILDEETCTITFNSTAAELYTKSEFYGVAITIRDYPRQAISIGNQGNQETKIPLDSLSTVPLQFLIKTPEFPEGCDVKPRFLYPTPSEGSTLTFVVGSPVSIFLVADNSVDTTIGIQSIDVQGPIGLKQSVLWKDKTSTNTFFKTLDWYPTPRDVGEHTVCATAANGRRKSSDLRCFTIQIDIDDCSNPNPCRNGGTCHVLVNGYRCTCSPGYTGKDCKTDIDDCSIPNKCRNGGTCHDLVNGFRCACAPGYTGKDCSIDIDECSNPNRCRNGGTCHDLVNGYRCYCSPGYTGSDCESDIDDCSIPNKCRNGGTCHDLVNGFRCACAPGYTGKDCSIDIDECSNPNRCRNGGTCHDLVNGYRCYCSPGYTGSDCESDIDDCSIPNKCRNGGTCHDLVNGFRCACAPGYTGKDCSIDIDECSNPNRCRNGGTCHDLVNGYRCYCSPGYTGSDCESDIDDCSIPNQCRNGGTCHDLVNGFSCACAPGYTGKDCSIAIGNCLNDPCKNGGVCYSTINDYVCECKPGYTDKNCATELDECLSGQCFHGGNCTDLINDFVCSCPPGFTGKHCHIGVDFCEMKPCKNGGMCENSFTGFLCHCVDGWQGKVCDYRPSKSQRSACVKNNAVLVTGTSLMSKQDSCCQATDYNNCKCFISPYMQPEEIERMDQTKRDLLSALIGFPLGLALSVLTYVLFWCCVSRSRPQSGVKKTRSKHHPIRRSPNRAQKGIEDQAAPVESSTRNNTSTASTPPSVKKLSSQKSVTGSTPSPGSAAGMATPMNIYRASFNDQGLHSTCLKKFAETYVSGAPDWTA